MPNKTNEIVLIFRRSFTKVFRNGTVNPSAKVAELINGGEHGTEKELITQANDVLYKPLAMALYADASKADVERLIHSSTASFNSWMDLARSACNGQDRIGIEGMRREELIALKNAIEKALVTCPETSATSAVKEEVDEDDFT